MTPFFFLRKNKSAIVSSCLGGQLSRNSADPAVSDTIVSSNNGRLLGATYVWPGAMAKANLTLSLTSESPPIPLSDGEGEERSTEHEAIVVFCNTFF